MKSLYTKEWLSLEDQIDKKLTPRGMIITDRQKAINYLKKIGYYRLSAYWHPFIMENNDKFQHDTYFSDIIDLYIFDKKFRILLLDAIERIEIAFRTEISYTLGYENKFAHKEYKFFNRKFRQEVRKNTKRTGFEVLQDKSEIKYNEKIDDPEGFKQHFHQKYAQAPIWVISELWDFGTLSHCFAGLKDKYQRIISNEYKLNPNTLVSWLMAISFIRNVCAHHARAWNRNIVNVPTSKNIPTKLRFLRQINNKLIFPRKSRHLRYETISYSTGDLYPSVECNRCLL